MNDILKTMPEMIMGQTLDDKLCILPEYDETIRQKNIPERLIALQDIRLECCLEGSTTRNLRRLKML